MPQTLAALFHSSGRPLEYRRFPTPEPHGEEILVRVLGCTLCGSDLHSYQGKRDVETPTILGHETVGRIIAFGPDALRRDLIGNEVRLGDRITWVIVASCGDCFFCRRDLPQKCVHGKKYGHEAATPGKELSGGLAEHCLLSPGTAIVRLPDELPLSVACPASCAAATVAAAMEAIGDVVGRSVCLIGLGQLGLTAGAMLRAAGAAAIVGVDVNAQRLERAEAFGVDVATAAAELTDVVAEWTNGRGFDVTIELAGNAAAFDAAWNSTRVGGSLVLVGAVFPSPPIGLSVDQVVRRNLMIRGVHNYAPRHLSSAVQFLERAFVDHPFESLVDRWLALEHAEDAFLLGRSADVIRIGVGGDEDP